LEPCKQLEKEGFEVTYLPVDGEGLVKINDLKKAIRADTFLVSVMWANNEIGTIEPIVEIGKLLKQINNNRKSGGLSRIAFHTDACQAAGALDINVNNLAVDLMTINGSKIYGPKQTGFLFVRVGTNIKPIIYGGGQEKALRSGTENVAGIVGLAKALELAQSYRVTESKRLVSLRDYFIKKILKLIPNVSLNGHKVNRLPNNIHLTIKEAEGEALMLYLDAKGIYVSTGSACNSSSGELSHVLMSIGVKPKDIHCSIRITLGKTSNKKDLEFVLENLQEAVAMLRRVKKL
jgi:cysteine desulfurase